MDIGSLGRWITFARLYYFAYVNVCINIMGKENGLVVPWVSLELLNGERHRETRAWGRGRFLLHSLSHHFEGLVNNLYMTELSFCFSQLVSQLINSSGWMVPSRVRNVGSTNSSTASAVSTTTK